jgi:hypothetical protein
MTSPQMKTYEDFRISFPIPESWHVTEDESNNLICADANDKSYWCSVEFSGLKAKTTDRPVPLPKFVLASCFEKELTSKIGALVELENGAAMIEWPEKIEHQGQQYLVHHFQIAVSAISGDVQLANFCLTIPLPFQDHLKIETLKKLVRQQSVSAKFKMWRKS